MGFTSTPSSPFGTSGWRRSTRFKRAIFWESVGSAPERAAKSASGLCLEELLHAWRAFPAVWRAVLNQEVRVESAVMWVVWKGMDFVEEPALDWFAVKITNRTS